MVQDRLQAGLEWLAGRMATVAARTVYYHRAGLGVVALPATVEPTPRELNDQVFGTPIEYQNVDFIVRAADLVLGGAPVAPERGDRVTDEYDGVRYTYEVMSPFARPPFDWADNRHHSLRVHTKEVSREGP